MQADPFNNIFCPAFFGPGEKPGFVDRGLSEIAVSITLSLEKFYESLA